MTAVTLLALITLDARPAGRTGGRMPCEDDPEKWFAEEGSAAVTEAKQACRACPARIPCLRFAMLTGERFGVWGGLSASDRGWGPGAGPRRAG
jgi:hypothetical protein